jgi:hypothetical protein
MRPKAWIYGREPGSTGALQVKQMLGRRRCRGAIINESQKDSVMSKYKRLWEYIQENEKIKKELSFS